jgi:N-methylhydantoinase A
VFAALEAEAKAWLEREGTPPEGRAIQRQASMRYRHQGFELTVPWTGSIAEAIAAFHRLHERLYTFALEETPVEIVNLRVSAIGRLPVPELPRIGKGTGDSAIGRQEVDFDGRPVVCTVHDRAKLGAGDRIEGPAIIRQLDTTTLLLPLQQAEVDAYGNLIIREMA